jgi:hypothetical protein
MRDRSDLLGALPGIDVAAAAIGVPLQGRFGKGLGPRMELAGRQIVGIAGDTRDAASTATRSR